MKPSGHSTDWSAHAAHLCGAATASVGALALAGWVTGLRELAGINDAWVPMAPNTAVALLLLGTALALTQQNSRHTGLVARVLSTVVGFVAVVRLGEMVLGMDWGVDQWIFQAPAEYVRKIPVGKTAFVTALGLLYSSTALYLIVINRWRLLVEVLGMVVGFVGLVFFMGYLYRAPLLYETSAIPMAITTAAAFCFLGTGTLISVAGRDLEARRLAAQQLRLQSAALEAAAVAILITDRRGVILWCNPAFTQLTGYTAAEAMGQTPRILKSGKHDVAFYRHLWKRILAGRIWHGEIVNKRKDDTFYTQEITITPVRDAQGVVTHFISIEQDITKRKQAEEELRRTKDAAEAANRAKSLFLANMSHELRTPLNSVIGFANILSKNKSGKLDPTDLGFVERIVANGKHLLGMISQVLDLSDIEAHKLQLHISPVPLEQLIPEIIAGFAFELHDRPIRLLTHLPERMAPLETDAVRLKHVLANLIGNALKFTERGSVTVRVTVDEQTRQPIRIDVTDTGIGIPVNQQASIFNAFQQADSGTTRKYGGAGLGLTLAKALCDLMGYPIKMHSEAGKGSTFSVFLTTQRGMIGGGTKPEPRAKG